MAQQHHPSMEPRIEPAGRVAERDALAVLAADHREVETLFNRFLNGGEPAIVHQICDLLEVHDRAERTYFYPDVASEGGSKARELVDDGKVEHKALLAIISQLREMRGDEVEFSEIVAWLQEQVLHHVHEEEKELFPIAREVLGEERLQSIGESITDLKRRAAQAH